MVDQCHRHKAATQHLWRLTDGKIGDHFFLLCGDVLALAWLELAHLVLLHQVHQAQERCMLFTCPLKCGALRLEEATKAGENFFT